MKTIKVKVSDLKSPDFNVRNHPKNQIDEIIRSIKTFGQIRPVVIDEDNVIYAGNGLYEAMKAMGAETIDAYRVEGLTDNQKKKLMLADNKTYALGSDNFTNIEALIKDIGDFDIPGFDEEILNNLFGEAEEVADNFDYGVISTEAKEDIFKGAEDKAQMERRFEEEKYAAAQTPAYTPMSVPTGESKDERRFIICPHCGEKIFI